VPAGVDRRYLIWARSTRGYLAICMFLERGHTPARRFREFHRRLAICPGGAASIKLGPSAVEGHYKLHKSLALASVPPPYELASLQGQ